ncbi:MAG: carbamate kinase [Thermoleophilia bacterium]|nr:carbamate kinase [Thermoleophilia bacterium]MDH4345216.1 carbamate kinase [Thermoleophilia bacterium]
MSAPDATRRPRVVVALGGNALLRRGEQLTAENQRHHAAEAMTAVAGLAGAHDVVLTHGNGPQVGLLALQSAAYDDVPPYPLDVLGAESEGMIGYVLEQELANRLPGRTAVTVLTQVVVDHDDPAFERPTKPIGPVYTEEQARRLERERGWAIARDGDHFRRVVPSPEPRRIVELVAIRMLVEMGAVVVCTGGGGIPVTVNGAGALRGVEAVIDKDLAAELLARSLDADVLLMLTDVPAVFRDWGGPEAAPIGTTTPAELRGLEFAEGSMGPKVAAACRFVERTGGTAAIGALEDAERIVAGAAGTVVTPDETG